MEACLAVEKEVDKVISKFDVINDHAKRVLSDLMKQVESLKEELQNGKYHNYATSQTKTCIFIFFV